MKVDTRIIDQYKNIVIIYYTQTEITRLGMYQVNSVESETTIAIHSCYGFVHILMHRALSSACSLVFSTYSLWVPLVADFRMK